MEIGAFGGASDSRSSEESDVTTLSNGVLSPSGPLRISCTAAIRRIRRADSDSASLASGLSNQRPCRLSSEETVCRLFFTR